MKKAPCQQSATALTHKQLPLESAVTAFREAHTLLAELQPFTLEEISAKLMAIGEKHTTSGKAGPFRGQMRLAVTGQQVSPPLFESVLALGRARVVERLDQILALWGRQHQLLVTTINENQRLAHACACSSSADCAQI
ncbi:MAG: hypothetical protein IPJ90_07485 [Anaerolineaceae bacterium]|nr:hypothetical protein [Anaerolineaceae bacterium]